jgi:SPW repeat-containing protein
MVAGIRTPFARNGVGRLWLIISLFVLGFTAASLAMGNAIIVGLVLGILGLVAALASPQTTVPSPR